MNWNVELVMQLTTHAPPLCTKFDCFACVCASVYGRCERNHERINASPRK